MKAKRFILHAKSNIHVKDNACYYIRNLPDDKKWEIVIKPWAKPRTDKQHGYYRALVGLCSVHTGYEKDELDDQFKTKGGFWKTVNGVEVLMSTNDMSVVQMIDLIDLTIRTASQDMELTLPTPEEMAAE